MALANVHLRYRLAVTNHGDAPLGPVILAAEMTSPPATTPPATTPPPTALPAPQSQLAERQSLTTLAPGARVEITDELRLPLGLTEAIALGGARMLVPLVRLRVEAGRANQPPLSLRQDYVVGMVEGAAAGHLSPFRLDLGPHIRTDVAAKPVERGFAENALH